ncbi:type II toxin-antitoxin system HicB family antitoxin [bacterium]|nr:MAG: type II toxin-antitoxin system HicB family antitoxin [bacterium]
MANKSTKILLYPVVIESCEEGGYFVDCPVLQGCHAEGDSYAEAIENIEDVIKAHIEVRKKHKEFIPGVILKKQKGVNFSLPVLIRA